MTSSNAAQLGRPGAPHLVEAGAHVGTKVTYAGFHLGAQVVKTRIQIANT